MPADNDERAQHVGTNVGQGDFEDVVECSCGWRSTAYWDLAEQCWAEFEAHLEVDRG